MDQSRLTDALETNEGKSTDFTIMQNFGLDLENATDSNIQSVMDKWMDVNYMLSLAAVSYTLDDDDGLFHWYYDGNASAYPHNFYFYEEPSEKKLYFIPWDLDKMLTHVADPELNNAVELIDDWGEITDSCRLCGNGWPQRRAACDKLVAGLVKYKEEYRKILQEIDEGPFTEIDAKLADGKNNFVR